MAAQARNPGGSRKNPSRSFGGGGVLFFEAVFFYIILSVLELIIQTKLASNLKLTEVHLSVPPENWD